MRIPVISTQLHRAIQSGRLSGRALDQAIMLSERTIRERVAASPTIALARPVTHLGVRWEVYGQRAEAPTIPEMFRLLELRKQAQLEVIGQLELEIATRKLQDYAEALEEQQK